MLPLELTIIAVTALLAGLLVVALMLAGRQPAPEAALVPAGSEPSGAAREPDAHPTPQTLRVAWWLTISIVLLGVGISGSFDALEGPIFVLGGAAVVAVVIFHELFDGRRRRGIAHLLELVTAVGLVAGLLALTGYASSPFAMLFALVAVAAALGFGPRAGIAAAVLATVAFAVVLLLDPALATYDPGDILRLGFGLGATWLLAFVAIAHADRQRRLMTRAIELSRTDPLTGLFNRSQLFVTLELEVSRTRRSDRGFCLLMVDLDGLKAVNDTHGHLRGDHVLRALGAVIAGSIRTVDSAYRYGGDEFVVLLPETDIVGAFVVAEKIRLGAEELDLALGAAPMTSVSIGLVSHPEDGLSAEELMLAADRAMYQAKSLGKNQISGNPRPRPALLARRSSLEQPRRTARPSSGGGSGEESEPAPEDRVTPIPLGPGLPAEPPASAGELPSPHPAPSNGEAADAGHGDAEPDDAEPDPQEVRRRIAVARRSFDPDHQVRRAMDAFFSPSVPAGEREQTTPEH